ncbi:MAG: MucB/RseB C-terminal domain-containing protein, partial [Alcanivoracaceae bacterium]
QGALHRQRDGVAAGGSQRPDVLRRVSQLEREQAVVSERPVRLEPRWLPAGFREAGADTRLEQGYPVTARSYSDGLASFTLFAEPLAERTMRDSVGRRGPTLLVTRVVELGGDRFAVSLVGEVPPATAEQVFAGLQLSLAGGSDD